MTNCLHSDPLRVAPNELLLPHRSLLEAFSSPVRNPARTIWVGASDRAGVVDWCLRSAWLDQLLPLRPGSTRFHTIRSRVAMILEHILCRTTSRMAPRSFPMTNRVDLFALQKRGSLAQVRTSGDLEDALRHCPDSLLREFRAGRDFGIFMAQEHDWLRRTHCPLIHAAARP